MEGLHAEAPLPLFHAQEADRAEGHAAAGIEGVGVMDNGAALAAGSGKALGIGALAIGNIKYQTQRGLFEAMLLSEKPLYLDFRDAFATARKHAG